MFEHPSGQVYEIRGRRIWVEQHGAGDAVLLPAGPRTPVRPFVRRPDRTGDRPQALRLDGLRSTDEPLRQEFAKATALVRFYDPGNAAVLERSGSFGRVEEAETVHSLLRDFWRKA